MDLIERITQLFHKTAPADPLPEPDARLALAALLVRVAKSDKTYQAEEISRIDKLLVEIYSLNPVEAAKMRATSERLEAAAPNSEAFAQVIRDNVSKTDRLHALRAMHAVMRADGVERPEEQDVITAASLALGLDLSEMREFTGKTSE